MVNMLSARPGLHVLEFHPSAPSHPSTGLAGLNMCMLYLASLLGHHYWGEVFFLLFVLLQPLPLPPSSLLLLLLVLLLPAPILLLPQTPDFLILPLHWHNS